ncbi:lysophosphatidic acid receptor 3 [Nematostella vectensis]|uniref:lysophosphatidic acid receptor 3 n=1 Tax=Nematostella vectensis TaxID=45351 RepID=UPI0013900134|nr:lysophosphatidic acid receptor 3 [Nematostella vectensis]
MGVIHEWHTSRLKPLYWVLITEGFIIFFFNSLSLVTFAANPNLRRRSAYFLISVAIADAMVGFAAIFCYGFILMDEYAAGWRFTGEFLWIASSSASINGLVLIAVERLHATFRPLHHRRVLQRFYHCGVCVQWIVAIPLGICFAATANAILVIWLRNFVAFLSLGILCISYLIIFVNVSRQRLHHGSPNSTRRDRVLAKTLFIVTALSLVTWLPDLLFHLVPGYTEHLLVHEVLMGVRLLNSIVNPIVYVLRMPDFRKTLAKIVYHPLWPCKKDEVVAISTAGDHAMAQVNRVFN